MTTTNRKLLIAANRPVDILRKFTFDTTGGKVGISTCNAFIKRIKGSTIVWNQQIVNGNFANGINGWNLLNASYTLQDSGIMIVRNSDQQTASLFTESIAKNTGHKHYIGFSAYSSDGVKLLVRVYNKGNLYDVAYRLALNSTLTKYSFIYTIPQEGSGTNNKTYFSLFDGNSAFIGNIKNFDLTLMFGAGNEPTSVEEFESMFPLDYYEYNAGELLSFNGDSVKAVGFNQFDLSKAEGGHVNTKTGEIVSNPTTSHSEYISVFPNTSYYCLNVSTLGRLAGVIFFDAQKNLIGYGGPDGGLNVFSASGRVTTPNNARYVRLNIKTTDVSISSVCFNLSNPLKNGTYEPYIANTKDISFYKSIKDGQGNTLFPYGLLSAGSVYDEVTENKAIKRVGAVDLGTLTWSYGATESHERMISQGIINLIKRTPNATTLGNILCAKYTTGTANDSWFHTIDNVIASDASGILYVYSTTMGTSSAAFKTAMQGVMLYYELAEPIEVDIEEQNLEYPAYRTGTEELLPANGAVPTTTPALFDIRYKIGGRRN